MCANPEKNIMVIEHRNFCGHVIVTIYTSCGLGGAGGVLGFRATQVQKESDV